MKYKLFTDGSCKGNGTKYSIGAYYAVLLDENDKIVAECGAAFEDATNQKAEIHALIHGCRMVLVELEDFFEVDVYSDSAYCINCCNDKWYLKWLNNDWKTSSKKPVANKDLWERIIPYFEDSRFTFHKTKGHANDKWNNYVDAHAQYLAEQKRNHMEEK